MKKNKTLFVIGTVLLILIIDQCIKIWVRTNMHLDQEIPIFGPNFLADRAKLHFIENEGMAFGMKLDWQYGKLLLSVFRIIAVGFLGWFIHTLIKKGYGYGVLLSFALILAGAAGNIIDSAFYGLIFGQVSPHSVVGFMPWGEGYAPFLHGWVVDMFHFPLFEFYWPEWMPWIGGDRFEFFRPVFNFADAAITVGVAVLLLFNRSFFREEEEVFEKNMPQEESVSESHDTLGLDNTPE